MLTSKYCDQWREEKLILVGPVLEELNTIEDAARLKVSRQVFFKV